MRKPYHTVLLGGLALAAVAAAVNLAFTWAGAYDSNGAVATILVVEFVGLVLILRATAAPGRGYLRQLGAGVLAVLVLAVLMFPTAYFAVTVVAPEYEDYFVDAQRSQLLAEGYAEPEVEERLQQLQAIPVPVRTAATTVLATLITCLPMVLVIAFFTRRRSGAR